MNLFNYDNYVFVWKLIKLFLYSNYFLACMYLCIYVPSTCLISSYYCLVIFVCCFNLECYNLVNDFICCAAVTTESASPNAFELRSEICTVIFAFHLKHIATAILRQVPR